MDRRRFLSLAGALASIDVFAAPSFAPRSVDTLVLIELNGGNDGLNTVIPIADPRYFEFRPTLAITRDTALPLDRHTALHPSLDPLMPVWNANELAIVQGVGYAMPNRSHFRSRQIWDTASDAHAYRGDGWLARSMNARACMIGTAEAGPFAQASDGFIEPFDDQARPFDAASQFIASRGKFDGLKIVRLALHGFDTHEFQAARHARLLAELGDGIASLRRALIESGHWRRTLVMTHSEFGRSARENAARGTDHGAAAPQFVAGGGVRGGLYGAPPRLDSLDDEGGVRVGIDFRRLYATALNSCGQVDAALSQRFEALPMIRA